MKSEQFLKSSKTSNPRKLENPEKQYKTRQRERARRAVKLENSEKHYKSRLSEAGEEFFKLLKVRTYEDCEDCKKKSFVTVQGNLHILILESCHFESYMAFYSI